MAQVEQIIKIRVQSKDAEKQLDSLQLQINANKEAQKNLNAAYAAGEVSAKDYARSSRLLKEESKALGSEQRQLTKETRATAGSYNDLSAQMARLKKEQKNVNVSTKAGQERFDKYANEINDVNDKLKKLDASNGVYTRNVGNYSSAISGLTSNMNIAGVNVGMLSTQLSQGATAIKGATSAIGGGTKALKLFKVALASTGIGLLIVALGSLVAWFTKTRAGGEAMRVAFAQIGQVVNVLIERLIAVGGGIVKIVSGDFKDGVEQLTGAFKGMGDELEREVSLIRELEERAIALEKAEILLNAQRANTKRQIKDLQLIAEDETNSIITRQQALEKAIKMQQQLNSLEVKIQKQKIKNILGETKGNEKLEYVLQTVRDGFTSVSEASNQANAIIDEIGLDPSTVGDLKTLIDEVIRYEDVQSAALKQERTLLTRLNSLRREAAKERKSGVAGVVKFRQDEIALMKAEESMIDDLIEDLGDESVAIDETTKARQEYTDTWINGILEASSINDIATNKELDNLEQVKLKRQELTRVTINGLNASLDVIDLVSQFQRAAMQRELAEAGGNAKKKEQIQKEYARKEKKIAVTQAIINGALAVSKVLAQTGVASPLAIPLIVAQTAGQIAVISSQEFANGGIAQTGGELKGASHANGGIPFKVGGRVGFEAEGGEAIINKRSTAMFKPMLSALNQAGGGKAFATGGQIPTSTGNNITNMFSMKDLAAEINKIKVVQELPTAMSGQNELNALTVNNKFA